MSPELAVWSGLILKMALTAAVVVVASVVVERSGSFLGALIASLPSAAGAAYIILAVEHPRSFIAASAVGSVAGAATVSVFCATYTLVAQRRGLILSLGLAVLAWFAAASALRPVTWTPLSALALDAAVFAVAIPLSSSYRAVRTTPKFLRTKFDIPLRALAAALVVVIVTTASYSIGSFASGVFALFPIILGSSIVVLHPRIGGKATASMTAHAQIALIGLALGFLAVHFLAEPLGSWWALAVGLLVCLGWSGLLWLVRVSSARRASPAAP